MSAQSAVTANTVVYSPAGVAGNLASWINRAAGVAGTFSNLTGSVTSPGPQGKVYRATWKLVVPVVATVDTTCACAGAVLRSSQVEVTFLLPTTSTTAERTDLELRFKDLVANGQFTASVNDLVLPTS